MKSEVAAIYQVGELAGQGLHVLRHHQDVVVRPEERHGAADLLVAVEGRPAGVPPGQVEALAAPVVARPEAEPDKRSQIDTLLTQLIRVTSMHGENLL